MRPPSHFTVSCACAFALISASHSRASATPPASDPESGSPQWRDDWGGVDDGEHIATFLLAATALLVDFRLRPDGPAWTQRWTLDERARAMRLRSPGARGLARTGSDVLLPVLVAYPFVIDAALVSWGAHGDRALAGRLAAVSALSFAATGALSVLTKTVLRRERPYVRHCDDNAGDVDGCTSSTRFRSFFSGHTAFAFTGAALTCTHHRRLALYGGAADAAACGVAAGLATTVGMLRLLADKHYLTDVLVGALVGVASGFVIPSALHYGFGN